MGLAVATCRMAVKVWALEPYEANMRYSPVFGLRSIDLAVQIAPSSGRNPHSSPYSPLPFGSHPTFVPIDQLRRSELV